MKLLDKLTCAILGHHWVWFFDPKYEGDKDGRFCSRCLKDNDDVVVL